MAARQALRCGMLALATVAVLSGCGKKGPLIPPEALAPAPITDLAVAQKGGQFQVSWSAPSKEEGGYRLRDLAGFSLYRHTVLPPDQECEECASAYSELARIDLEYLQKVKKVGNRFYYSDADLRRDKTYQYKVRSFNTDLVESKDSNKARHTVLAPPYPPVVEASSTATGVVLSFVALPPEEGNLTGYNVYRAKAGTPMPLAPLATVPATAKTYEDKEVVIGVRYGYTVTSVIGAKGETAESAPSNEVEGALAERD